MNQLSNPASSAAPQVDLANDAFDRLTLLGWRGGLAATTAALAASFFLFGYALIYWRNADMDFMVIYNALALNDATRRSVSPSPISCCTRSDCLTHGRYRPFRRPPMHRHSRPP